MGTEWQVWSAERLKRGFLGIEQKGNLLNLDRFLNGRSPMPRVHNYQALLMHLPNNQWPQLRSRAPLCTALYRPSMKPPTVEDQRRPCPWLPVPAAWGQQLFFCANIPLLRLFKNTQVGLDWFWAAKCKCLAGIEVQQACSICCSKKSDFCKGQHNLVSNYEACRSTG